ncbi:hypothetical protein BP6252_10497 [Coleophoma cylindrospora]|uniref:Uncharacterized protein n=1 Tax=Coleophoma cylindrospora TaxID=1849047 RepID=A0A3D8QSP1_9HELO|nr:hypothetical protein BP6252_10497 [Coleophoma cylindrospora]
MKRTNGKQTSYRGVGLFYKASHSRTNAGNAPLWNVFEVEVVAGLDAFLMKKKKEKKSAKAQARPDIYTKNFLGARFSPAPLGRLECRRRVGKFAAR